MELCIKQAVTKTAGLNAMLARAGRELCFSASAPYGSLVDFGGRPSGRRCGRIPSQAPRPSQGRNILQGEKGKGGRGWWLSQHPESQIERGSIIKIYLESPCSLKKAVTA